MLTLIVQRCAGIEVMLSCRILFQSNWNEGPTVDHPESCLIFLYSSTLPFLHRKKIAHGISRTPMHHELTSDGVLAAFLHWYYAFSRASYISWRIPPVPWDHLASGLERCRWSEHKTLCSGHHTSPSGDVSTRVEDTVPSLRSLCWQKWLGGL